MNISSISNLSSHLSAATQTAQQPKPTSQDQKTLIQAVKTVNSAQLFGQENELTFIIDRAANIAVVRIVNKKTGAVVQQIPSAQVLKLADEVPEGSGTS
jgi:uncharacterized FlaG/YvyC family protein